MYRGYVLAVVLAAVVSWSSNGVADVQRGGRISDPATAIGELSAVSGKPDGKAIVLARNTGKQETGGTPGRMAAKARQSDARAVNSETVVLPAGDGLDLLSRDPLDLLRLDDIKPLYTSPVLPGEGVWETCNSPRDATGKPVVYKTFYRPSVDFPNAVVYMMIVDMRQAVMQYYVGSQEPAAPQAKSEVESSLRSRVLAITNAMWQQRHSSGAGAVFRGKVLYSMVDGMATLIVYRDGSVDIQEWSSDIPIEHVHDARQLRHLIVKDGVVVQAVNRGGRLEDAEIGLGFLLGGGGKDLDGKHFWYVAHRSAFGIRKDGNLVFAIGHHIGSKDLAKALVLAGCERGIHADANPHNIVGNLYVRDSYGNLIRKLGLSPEQSRYSLNRYEDGYTKDFFAFFLRNPGISSSGALSRRGTANRSHQ
ncbi:MAG: hypothetical protein RDU20_13195 [Desulfomonilaceae bacterium]|nr:hypothetical protein [Desulfomonilaceae bacterium]